MKRSAEAILPKPLDPVELTPEYDLPQVLASWANGSLLVSVSHDSKQYVKKPNLNCQGQVVVPIPAGATGNRERFCGTCEQPVTINGIGAIRIIVNTHKEQLTKKTA